MATPRKTTTRKPQQRTITLPERVTLLLDQPTRTAIVGLHAKNGEQRCVTLHEPNMVEYRQLQAEARQLDADLPKVEPFADAEHPTGDEITERSEQATAQAEFIFGEELPYGTFFLHIIEACSDEEVKPEELPSWAIGLDASRQVLDFFRSLSGGLAVDLLLSATPQPAPQ